MDRWIDPRQTIEISGVELAKFREWIRERAAGRREEETPQRNGEASRDAPATKGLALEQRELYQMIRGFDQV